MNYQNLTPEQLADLRQRIDNFNEVLDKFPPKEILEKTPDGKAWTLPISHVESRLDTYFMGQWSTRDYEWQVLQNEIIGRITLVVIHPVTFQEITRVGSASIQITVDALPQEEKARMPKKEINSYALDVMNKKPNALYLSAGKLLAECTKNAAAKFGKALGRDLNRNVKSTYTRLTKKAEKQNVPLIAQVSETDIKNCLTLCGGESIPDFLKKEFVTQNARGNVSKQLVNEILSYGKD